MYKKILVPLDGSKVAEGVLPHARALAYSEGAELILLTVAANPAMDFAFSDPGLAQSAVLEHHCHVNAWAYRTCALVAWQHRRTRSAQLQSTGVTDSGHRIVVFRWKDWFERMKTTTVWTRQPRQARLMINTGYRANVAFRTNFHHLCS